MARQRSPDRDKAEKLYIESNGSIKLKEIADTLGLPEGTIRGWKNKDQWEQKLNGTFRKQTIKNTERSNKKNNKSSSKKEPIADEVKEVLENIELTDKQRLFCIYYSKCFNATKAYKKAYECSYDVANAEGYKFLVNPCIKNEIQKLKQNKLNRAMLSEDDIFQKYIDIAFADITDYVEFGQKELPAINPLTGEKIIDEKGKEVTYTVNYVDFKDSGELDGTIISEVSKGKDGVKVKLHDKMKALDWLANHMDLLDTATREKLKLERDKFDADQMKKNGDSKDVTIKVTLEDDES